jgi:AcrR family transcriptional regulator
VATGTLFRYASTKAELLLMVFNDDFRRNLDRGLRDVSVAAAATASATTSGTAETSRLILILLTPLILAGRRSGANTAAYQREILFGEPSERYRAEALVLVDELQNAISNILAPAARNAQQNSGDTDSTLAARAVSNVVHLELARAALDGTPAPRVLSVVAAQIDLITRGHLKRAPGSGD